MNAFIGVLGEYFWTLKLCWHNVLITVLIADIFVDAIYVDNAVKC